MSFASFQTVADVVAAVERGWMSEQAGAGLQRLVEFIQGITSTVTLQWIAPCVTHDVMTSPLH